MQFTTRSSARPQPIAPKMSNPSQQKYIAFYDTYPTVETAETENLKRFEIVCKKLNVGFLLINNGGYVIKHPTLNGTDIRTMDSTQIICIISLHFYSLKNTQHYTMLALWNPIKYHNDEIMEHMPDIDGFLSAHSNAIDKHITDKVDKPIVGFLNTTVSDPILEFTFGEYKCFYCGINWYALPNADVKRINILDAVKEIDDLDMVSIYGPERIYGVRVWDGFKNYKYKIPFDGVSVIYEIHKCGICLALSSDEHVESEIASNRFFEGLAAGVPIIANPNPFIVEWFGDNVFYVDLTKPGSIAGQISEHIKYFKENPENTLKRMQNCRNIFLRNFTLDGQLQLIINSIPNSAKK